MLHGCGRWQLASNCLHITHRSFGLADLSFSCLAAQFTILVTRSALPGAAAILLTNKRSEARRSKYQLEHLVRVHLGADDTAYK